MILIICCVITTGEKDQRGTNGVISLADGWKDRASNIRTIDDVYTNGDGSPVVLEKKLMMGLRDADCLCFASYNVDLDIYVEDRNIYSFRSLENLTGKGYGTAFHEVDLPGNLGGKILRIEFESSDINKKNTYGYISHVYLGSAMSYTQMMFDKKAVSVGISVFIVFFGIILVLMSITTAKRASLGVATIIIGLWFLTVTDVIQLLTGAVYLVRVLNRILILLFGYPIVRFFNSLTVRRRMIYPLIEIIYSIFSVTFLISMRYFSGIDMMGMFPQILASYFVVMCLVITIMFIDDEMHCRSLGMLSRLRKYYIGITIFLVCVLIDFVLYLMRRIVSDDVYGNASRIGILVIIAIVLRNFINWWTRDRAVVERGRLISRSLSVSSSGDAPDECIKQVLEYAGEQFKAGRAVILEDQQNGKYHGTYAWFEDTEGTRASDILYIQQNGIIDEILKTYEANEGRFAIDDIDSYKSVNINIYNMLRSQNIKSIVICPLRSGEKVTGILAICDLPSDMLEEVSENARLIAYFLSELILKRDEEKRTRIFNYNDPLSGALNRRAFNEFTSGLLDRSQAFGLLLCEISNLEKISSEKGYEAGDRMVSDTVSIMSEVFGRDNVYRLVGSKFAALGFETDEAFFEDDAERLVKQARIKGVSLSVGYAYCINGANDINTVIKHAQANMH